MSHKEQLVQLVSDVPERQAAMIYFMVQNYLNALEDAEDNAFCLALDDAYEADPDNNGEGVPIEELAARLGVALE